MDKEYIKIKIENCKYLISNANSAAQKAVYQGYLELWQEKAKNIKIHPSKPKKEPPEEPEEEEVDYESMFKIKYPNKNAYYIRDGRRYSTKLFIEFLKSSE